MGTDFNGARLIPLSQMFDPLPPPPPPPPPSHSLSALYSAGDLKHRVMASVCEA